MKRTWVIFSLAFVLLILAIIEQVFLDGTLTQLAQKGENLLASIEQSDVATATTLTQELDDFWEQKEKWVCLVINHEDIEQIGEQILRIKNFLQANQVENARQETKLYLFYVEGCQHLLVSSIQNVF